MPNDKLEDRTKSQLELEALLSSGNDLSEATSAPGEAAEAAAPVQEVPSS